MSNLTRKLNAWNGVNEWLKKNGYDWKTLKLTKVTAKFLKGKGETYAVFNPRYKGAFAPELFNCEKIIEHYWVDFKTWIKENYSE